MTSTKSKANQFQPAITFPEDDARQIEQSNVCFKHNLAESAHFNDTSLAELLENYPREYYNLVTMRRDNGECEWLEGDFNNLSGKEILQAVKAGRFWINLRRFDINAPHLARMMEETFSLLDASCPALKTSRQESSLLISSPKAEVFYHMDVPMVALWHIRGEKKIWLYDPANPEHLPDEIRERVILRETEEDIPYDPSWDYDAQIIHLKSGDAVTWPQNAPHRVENLDSLNVSITSDYFTPKATKRYGVYYANGMMRRKLGWTPTSTRSTGLEAIGKCVLALGIKKTGLIKIKEREMITKFKMNSGKPRDLVWLAEEEQSPIAAF